jgi:hypothetical protein
MIDHGRVLEITASVNEFRIESEAHGMSWWYVTRDGDMDGLREGQTVTVEFGDDGDGFARVVSIDNEPVPPAVPFANPVTVVRQEQDCGGVYYSYTVRLADGTERSIRVREPHVRLVPGRHYTLATDTYASDERYVTAAGWIDLATLDPDAVLVTCARCHSVSLAEHMTLVESLGQMYCPACADTYIHVCEGCGQPILDGAVRDPFDSRTYRCVPCHEAEYVLCFECGIPLHRADAHERGGVHVCGACHGRVIRDYHSCRKDGKKFGRSGPFFGFELEIENEDNGEYSSEEHNRVAATVRDMFDDGLLFFEYDGSLDYGFEIITAPMSRAYFNRNKGKFVAALAYLTEQGYRSHETSTCGLHVHVGREGFGECLSEQDYTITKTLLIIEHWWRDVVKISRRESESHYAKRIKSENLKTLDDAKNSGDRYTAVNLCNEATVEFRFFKGTLKSDSLIAAVDFVFALIDTASRYTPKRIIASRSLRKMLGKKTVTPVLSAYLDERLGA